MNNKRIGKRAVTAIISILSVITDVKAGQVYDFICKFMCP